MQPDSSAPTEAVVEDGHLPDRQVPSDKGSQLETGAAPFSFSRRYKVGWYVDGFNLYHAMDALNEPGLKWLNIHSLASSYLRKNQSLERIVFSTAYNTWDAGKRQRHMAYARALELETVQVIPAVFDPVQKWCRKQERYCRFHEEKQSDVNLAVEALSDAYDGKVDTLFFLTADSDQIPTFRAIRRRFEDIRIYLVAPPERLHLARELGQHAHAVFELTAGRIRAHQLQPEYRDSKGRLVTARPASYGSHGQ